MMPTAIHRQVEAARRGELERVVARMLSGWAVLGDPQLDLAHDLLVQARSLDRPEACSIGHDRSLLTRGAHC